MTVSTGHAMMMTHQLLSLAVPLGGEGLSGDVEKGGPGFMRERLGQHRLAVAWRAVQQEAPGRSPEALEEVRPQCGQDDHLLQCLHHRGISIYI